MAVTDHVDLPTFMEGVKKRNPGQPEFWQAVQEVSEDIFDFIEDKELYHSEQILRRIAGAGPDHLLSRLLGGRCRQCPRSTRLARAEQQRDRPL